MLALTQLFKNWLIQLIGAYFLWKETLLDKDMPLHVFQTLLQPRILGKGKSKGWYFMTPWGAHAPFHHGMETIMVLDKGKDVHCRGK